MDTSPKVSVIVPIRNRSGVRLHNCLRSLAWQDGFEAGELELIVSDFGSEEPHRSAIERACETWSVRRVYCDTQALWSRSRALNIGIQAASGVLVLCTDVDMVFAQNFVAEAVAAVEERQGKAIALCQSRDLPEECEDDDVSREEFEAYLARTTMRPTYGVGACQCAPRSWFLEVRGYDEGFRWWGFEDQDMLSRAVRCGLEPVWITEETAMLHQWHPKQNRAHRFRIGLNRWRFRLLKPWVKRNRRGWGQH